MIFHPVILALYVSSTLICFTVLYASVYAVQILRRWDLRSGSELQLVLERKTYLISTLLTYFFGFELLSLFLYIFTADQLHVALIGAMCAAGSLYANVYGYPTLILKLLNFLLAGLWLIMNHVDNRAFDYPLIKIKYAALLLLTPGIIAEMVLQANYFLRLEPNIITSCCGTLFSTNASSLMSDVIMLPADPMKAAYFVSLSLTVVAGIAYYRKGKGGYLLALGSAATCLVSLMSILSFIGPYFYELPTHHCPFCILQKDYGYVGYPFYLALVGATISGTGVGMLMPFRKIPSLCETVPSIQKKLALAAIILFGVSGAISAIGIYFSNLVLS